MSARRVGAIILAAGASSRLGEPKQLVVLGGEMLVRRAVRVAREAGCEPVIAVLGARANEVKAELPDVRSVLNPGWAEGLASSIRMGVRALQEEVDAVVVMACDQPAVSPAHLRLLMQGEGRAVASGYAGRRGIPACFPACDFPALLALQGDRGARDLLEKALAVDLPGGGLDIDTPETLAIARAVFEGETRR